jgi:hypothetical protein
LHNAPTGKNPNIQIGSRACLKIPNLTPKSPLHVVERGLETPLFSPSLRSGEGGEVKGKIEFSNGL